MYLACFACIQLLPHFIKRLRPCGVEWLAEGGDEGEPIDGALVQEGLLKDLPLEFLEEDSVLIQGLR